ncbi:HAAS signaling domain-containing protein [Streptomyces sp. BH105]|uniref:HAAS signaling domain-containing protein n=1 Tax=Streptomyces sp. BH105 TaxID=3410408 RepID=UPI003CE9F7B9
MGIESDQIVFDYLSKVGDLAQSRQLPSSARMRLVADLRTEIDRRRTAGGAESPAAVRKLIGRLGTPDQIVAGAKDGDGTYDFGDAGDDEPDQGRGALGRIVPKARAPRAPRAPRPPRVRRRAAPDEPPVDAEEGPAPVHLAGTEELGTIETADWWSAGGGGIPGTEVDDVPGFVGGIEIPDILKPPGAGRGPDLRKRPLPEPARYEEYEDDDVDDVDDGEEDDDAAEGAAKSGLFGARRLFRPRRASGRVPRASFGRSFTQPFLLLAALALVVGAVLGNILVLLIGWAVVYLSRQLTTGQKKWAVFGLPGAAALAGIVWLWGRGDGRWGDPIADGRLSGALDETWPWVLRCAAFASALYLIWRARSPRL